MAGAIQRRMYPQTTRDDSQDVTLPCILGRLARLEKEGFSYDELLHDFASRRRVGPVNERAVKHVLDPAQETDERVQVRQNLGPTKFSVVLDILCFCSYQVCLKTKTANL